MYASLVRKESQRKEKESGEEGKKRETRSSPFSDAPALEREKTRNEKKKRKRKRTRTLARSGKNSVSGLQSMYSIPSNPVPSCL
jgi:hypothetical protein